MTSDPTYFLSVFRQRLGWFLAVAIGVTVLGTLTAFLLPARYQAEALLLFESEQIPDTLAPSTVRTGAAEQLKILEQQLLTRANLLEIANSFDIYGANSGLNAADIVEDMRDRVEISSAAARNDVPTITIAFLGDSANQSLQVTNQLVNILLQRNVAMRTGRATQTLEFFRQEVERLGANLDRQETELLAFRTANQDALPDSLEFRRAQQSALQERLLQLQREEAAQTDRSLRLTELYERTGRVEQSGVPQTPAQQSLLAARAELDAARLIYSDQHPRIKALQAQVLSLERVAAAQGGAPTDTAGMSLFDIQRAQLDGELKFIEQEKALVTEQIAALQESIAKTPANAAREAELARESEITRSQYTEAVARLAAAQTGERIEALSKGQRISVIEQPVLPLEPASPQRGLIVLGSLAAGTALGLGLVVLLEVFNRAIRRPSELVAALSIMPIATLPYIYTEREQQSHRLVLGAGGLTLLVMLGATIYGIHTWYMPLDLLGSRIVDMTGLRPMMGEIRRGLTD